MSYKPYSKLGIDENAPSPDSMVEVPHITSHRERDAVIGKNRIVVIDNYADWCGPCKYVAPHYGVLAKKHGHPGLCAFYKEDVDQRLPGAPTITGVPCFHFYLNGTYQPQLTVTGGDIGQVTNHVETLLKRYT